MNRHSIKYLAEDSIQGIKRNPASTAASVFLTAVALLLIGLFLSARLFADDAITYIESQLSLKVYLDQALDAKEVAKLLEEQGFAEHTEIQTGTENLETLAFLFNGKEHLLEAFAKDGMLDAVKLYTDDKSEMAVIAQELSAIEGIEQVVYPQQMAVFLDSAIERIEQYGLAATLFFFAIAFLMVYLTFHLALYKRKQELAVKLFMGMNPKMVQVQFLLEGALLSLMAAVIAVSLTAGFHLLVLHPLQQSLPFLGEADAFQLTAIAGLQIIAALLLGLAASFLATRKLIADG